LNSGLAIESINYNMQKSYKTAIAENHRTEFWKITHMGTPETIKIFEFSMALLIAETTSKLYL